MKVFLPIGKWLHNIVHQVHITCFMANGSSQLYMDIEVSKRDLIQQEVLRLKDSVVLWIFVYKVICHGFFVSYRSKQEKNVRAHAQCR